MTTRLLLFVCSGNVCRSPMAESLLRARLPTPTDWVVASAGTMAAAGMRATPEAMAVLAERGIDLGGHASQRLTSGLIARAEVLVVMTHNHRDTVIGAQPAAAGKTFLLRGFDPHATEREVDDPIGGGLRTYRLCRDQIQDCLPGLVEFMQALRCQADI